MTVYFIATSTITDQAQLGEYMAAAPGTLGGHDVSILAVDVEAAAIEGTPPGSRVVILGFPDRAAFDAWYNSDAYQAIVGKRLSATTGHSVLVQGLG